jgi:hypothetical protein
MRQPDSREYYPEGIALIQSMLSGDTGTAARVLETFDHPEINALPFAMVVAQLAAHMIKGAYGGDEGLALKLTGTWLDTAVHKRVETLDAARRDAEQQAS